MASFYGGPSVAGVVTKDSVTQALGFTPVLYALVKESKTNTVTLKALENLSDVNTPSNTYFTVEQRDGKPTLIISSEGKRYKFIGEEI